MSEIDQLEPLDYYKQRLKDKFAQTVRNYFDNLVKVSGVNEELNAQTVSKYNVAQAKAEKDKNQLGAARGVKILLIVLTVLAFVAAAVMIAVYAAQVTYDTGILIGGIVCAVSGGAMIALLATAVKKWVLKRQAAYERSAAKAAALKNEAFTQLRPLHALFNWEHTRELLQQAMPFAAFDTRLERERLELLVTKYGYDAGEDDADSSVIFLLSGSIEGNPFLFERRLCHALISTTYTGTLVIHWTTTHTDSEGHIVTDHHTQTLVASIQRPAPQYTYNTRLIYGNEAAPDLSFSRQAKHLENYSESERDKMVKKGEKQLAKKARKATQQGGGFTELGNSEFDVLFGATDRNHEVQFRLMFTPLAQTNLLELMTSKEGYGDDFAFRKRGMFNSIRSGHAQMWDTDCNPSRYVTYDLKAARQAFTEYNFNYLKSVYFDLAPLLSVPLYRMTKPHEYIYRGVYASNYTSGEAEALANTLGEGYFAAAGTNTRSILKTSLRRKVGQSDVYNVTAFSYHTEPRVEYVSVLGGDGLIHAVPVPWTEYIPISRTDEITVHATGESKTDFERRRAYNEFASFANRYSPDGAAAYADGLVGIPTSGTFGPGDDELFANALNIRAAAATATAALATMAAIEAAADLADKEPDGAKPAEGEQQGVSKPAEGEQQGERAPAEGEQQGEENNSISTDGKADGENK